jgi:plastocyanin
MHPLRSAVALSLMGGLLLGCDDATHPTPAQSSLEQPGVSHARARSAAGGTERRVNMTDACDPTSFNAVLGPGTCTRNGGVRFTQFIELLRKHQTVGAWHFAPPRLRVKVGQTLLAVNRGGEVHTFTEVDEFGGGIVPDLNALSGNPTPAPECLTLEPDDFVPPGGTYTDEVEVEGVERYMCCIHPWMRTTVHARSTN